MILYNRYLSTLAVLFGFSTAILAAYGQNRLDAYLTLYVIEYLIVTLLFVYLDPKGRRFLDATGYVLFGGFLVIVMLRVIEILRGS